MNRKRKKTVNKRIILSLGMIGLLSMVVYFIIQPNKAVQENLPNNQGSELEENKPKQDKNNSNIQLEFENNVNERAVVANPEAKAVLVNPQNMLPDGYVPDDLVYPNVRFTFEEQIEKRMMRAEAAEALEKLFAAADQDGLPLAGVSAYRSNERQKQLFDDYVEKDGLEKAQTYSAYPGTSEHETGLAIDVAGADGSCAVSDCFDNKPEAKWLADNAHRFGFIIRYPKGKEEITGYKYEPWHLRYVGPDIAEEIQERDITLEEYYDAVPVSK
ncbi:M15 family metallopeptidase [Amphibacillus sp. Q70]|uniref:M15 family metallopeptidase n=1 Tax=Amphibacillus sp. Q70 TaxID=3453416 RepID=UPI003F8478B4